MSYPWILFLAVGELCPLVEGVVVIEVVPTFRRLTGVMVSISFTTCAAILGLVALPASARADELKAGAVANSVEVEPKASLEVLKRTKREKEWSSSAVKELTYTEYSVSWFVLMPHRISYLAAPFQTSELSFPDVYVSVLSVGARIHGLRLEAEGGFSGAIQNSLQRTCEGDAGSFMNCFAPFVTGLVGYQWITAGGIVRPKVVVGGGLGRGFSPSTVRYLPMLRGDVGLDLAAMGKKSVRGHASFSFAATVLAYVEPRGTVAVALGGSLGFQVEHDSYGAREKVKR